MEVFKAYSRYYDLLYKEKDYKSEAEYVYNIIKKYNPEARFILEFGCGTGAHAQYLADLGLVIYGIDISEEMIQRARIKKDSLPGKIAKNLTFCKGDLRKLQLNQTFDAVVSLFHVMSYQITNYDIKSGFLTANKHLKTGGLFIFDCWYGPAVLTDRPQVRIKRFQDESIEIIRIAEPLIEPNDNVVEVNYTLIVKDKKEAKVQELKETHRVRYFFRPEIELFCTETGFELIKTLSWMTDVEPDFESWYVCFVLKKR